MVTIYDLTGVLVEKRNDNFWYWFAY